MNYKLLSAIIKGTWAIDEKYATGMGSFVQSLISGENVMLDEKAEYPYTIITKDSSENNNGTVRVIPVKGILMKDDQYCGPAGTASIGQRIKAADNDTDIDAIVLDIDTPGGTVDGTEVFADIIKNTKKPVIGFINGLMASAGMWVGSATDKLIASTEHDEIGSIGVMLSFADIQPAWELQGVKFHEIYSNLSGDKNIDFKKLRKGDYEDYKKNILDPLAEKFQETVKANLPSVKEDQLTGKIYFAKDVKGSLINEIGSFDYAVSEALKLAKSNTNSNKPTMSKEKEDFFADEKSATSWLEKNFGIKSKATKEAEKKAADEKAAVEKAASDKIEADKIEAAKVAEENKAADELKIATDKIAEFEKENAALKGKAGAKTIIAVKKTDGNEDVDPAKIDLSEGKTIEEKMQIFNNEITKGE